MRKWMIFLLCLCLLTPTVKASEVKYVALTFDDGPSGRFTRRLLDGLEARQAKATFLLCGYRLEQYPKEAQRIFESGHEIGLHGYSHDDMGKMTQQQVIRELEATLALLPEGCKPGFLRPPGGSSGKNVALAAEALGIAILNWSVDPRDWAVRDPVAVETAVLDEVQNGDVILLHDMSDSSVDAALAIVDRLKAKGYRFVTASELARLQGVTPVPGMLYNRFS